MGDKIEVKIPSIIEREAFERMARGADTVSARAGDDAASSQAKVDFDCTQVESGLLVALIHKVAAPSVAKCILRSRHDLMVITKAAGSPSHNAPF